MKEEKKDHESGEEGDDEKLEQPTETTVEQESATQVTEEKTDVDETISSTSMHGTLIGKLWKKNS